MKFERSLTVPASPETTWAALTDIRRVVECLPGASVDTLDGSHFTGRIRLKVGPIQVSYRGAAEIVEQDDEALRLTFEAHGRETKGAGTADARVSARLVSHTDSETGVLVSTTFEVTGKPAQFGSSVIHAVGARVLDNFANNLATELAGERSESLTGADAQRSTHPNTSPAGARRPGELDLLEVAVPPWVRRHMGTAAAALCGVLAARLVTRLDRKPIRLTAGNGAPRGPRCFAPPTAG